MVRGGPADRAVKRAKIFALAKVKQQFKINIQNRFTFFYLLVKFVLNPMKFSQGRSIQRFGIFARENEILVPLD